MHKGGCVAECPNNYMMDENDKNKCKPCPGTCPKGMCIVLQVGQLPGGGVAQLDLSSQTLPFLVQNMRQNPHPI